MSTLALALIAFSAAEPRKYETYDYTDAAKKAKLRLVIPDGLAVVRGILVVPPFSGGDTREFHQQVWYREFLHFHGFAFLGADWAGSNEDRYKVFHAALKQFAAESKHPELLVAPYAATGFSAGGGFSSKLVAETPEKVIAAVIVGSRLNLNTITDKQRGTPVFIINGEDEGNGMAALVEPQLAAHRPKDALWGWMSLQGIGHERDAQEVFAMPMLDAAVRLRYPAGADVRKGPVKLKPVDPASGWVADNTTWKNGLTSIASAKEFKGDVKKSSWLLNEDLAFACRAMATYDKPLKITSPRHTPENARTLVWDAGDSATISVDDTKFAGWKKLELFDNSKKVAELTKEPATFAVKDLKAGYHVFTVLGTDAKGDLRTSDAILVTVRK
ncbi:MAG: hypothetical protein U0791_12635 [Gemmataceae bacterium]